MVTLPPLIRLNRLLNPESDVEMVLKPTSLIPGSRFSTGDAAPRMAQIAVTERNVKRIFKILGFDRIKKVKQAFRKVK